MRSGASALRRGRWVARRRRVRAWLGAALLASLAMTGCGDPPPPKLAEAPLGTLPSWAFTNERGQAIGSKQLAGQPYVVNFLFTSCPSACPPLAKATRQLQDKVTAWRKPGGPKLVSITVDPITDTAEALRMFARKYGAKPSVWSFARAPYKEMEKLVVGGFYQPLLRRDRKPGQPVDAVASKPTPIDTSHSVRFVLVDGQGRMRGLYEKDPASLAELDAHLRWLAEHPGK